MTARSYAGQPSINSSVSPGGGNQFRVVLLGSGLVGKTALLWRLFHGRFLYQYVPTVEDSYRHLVQLPDGRFKGVEILDTAGAHEFPAMRDLNIKRGHAFFVVYSIDDHQSFVDAVSLLDLIQRVKPESVPIALVGNKLDLADQGRAVSTDEASRAASSRQCAFAETSAKAADLGPTVDALFGQLLVSGFDVPLPSNAVSPSAINSSAVKDTSSGGIHLKAARGPSQRRRLGRSRSAGVMTTAAPTSGTTDRDTTTSRHRAPSDVRQPQRQRSTSQTELGRDVNADVTQDSRCVIL